VTPVPENHDEITNSRLRRAQFAWAMYDFANTIFSMNIVTFFFSPWIIITLGVEDIWFSLAYSASMIVVAFTMPGLGRKADQTAGKIRGLRSYTLMCVFFTVLLSLVAILHLSLTITAALALLCFACANYYYEGGITYYNALLSDVSNPSNVGKISGIGVGLGYIGAIAGLWLVAPFVDGSLSSSMSGREYAFLPTAMFFLIFALPAFFWIKEHEHTQPSSATEESYFKRMSLTLKETRDYPGVLRFLISDFLVEDAIATTIVFMAVYAEAVVGFAEADKRILFLSSTAFAFVGSFLFGYLADRIRPKNALIIALIGWVSVLAIGVGVSSRSTLYVVGGLVGMFLGAVWTTARPLLNSLVPAEKLGQFYGLYSLSGRSAATVGPLIWGLIALIGKHDMPLGRAALSVLSSLGVSITENLTATIHYRLALASLLVAMLAGLMGFVKVPNRRRYSKE
jgi:MFS transporter, UMF1 family